MTISKIEVGDLEVIGESTVLSYNQEPIKIKVTHENDPGYLILNFIFLEDKKESGVELSEANNIGDDLELEIIVKNHYGKNHVGPTKPILIGGMSGRELYLDYNLNSISKDDPKKIVFYLTVLLGDDLDLEENEVS